jgi:hypothetical protein
MEAMVTMALPDAMKLGVGVVEAAVLEAMVERSSFMPTLSLVVVFTKLIPELVALKVTGVQQEQAEIYPGPMELMAPQAVRERFTLTP